MRRGPLVLATLALCSCASTADLDDGSAVLLGGGVPPNDDDRVAVCVTSLRFEADVYGRAAFVSGMREAFEETEFSLERWEAGAKTWIPAGTLPNRYRLAACDSAPGARRLQLVLSLTSPLFEQPVATPWGSAYTLEGIRCVWHMDPLGAAAADALTDGRCTAYFRGWNPRDGGLTAEMGRRFGS